MENKNYTIENQEELIDDQYQPSINEDIDEYFINEEVELDDYHPIPTASFIREQTEKFKKIRESKYNSSVN